MTALTQSNDINRLDSMHMLMWALGFTVLGLPMLPIGFGYILSSMAVVFASIALGKAIANKETSARGVASGLILGINAAAMLGYLGWVLANSPNYMS